MNQILTIIRLLQIAILLVVFSACQSESLPTVAAIPTQITPSPTATITPSPTITPTFTITPTVSPAVILQRIVEDAPLAQILSVDINPDIPIILIHFDMLRNRIDIAEVHMQEMLCAIQQSGQFTDYNIQFSGRGHFQDALANPIYEDGIVSRIDADIISQINCESGGAVNWEVASYYYEIHRLLDK